MGPGSYNLSFPQKSTQPSFSFGYKESSIFLGYNPNGEKNDNNMSLPKIEKKTNKDEEKTKKIENLKKLAKSKAKRSLSDLRMRNDGPGPGFYQPNYSNLIDGPKIKYNK